MPATSSSTTSISSPSVEYTTPEEAILRFREAEDKPIFKLLKLTIASRWYDANTLNSQWSATAANTAVESLDNSVSDPWKMRRTIEELIAGIDLDCRAKERGVISALSEATVGLLEFLTLFGTHVKLRRHLSRHNQESVRVHHHILKFILLDRLLWANDASPLPIQHQGRYCSFHSPKGTAATYHKFVRDWRKHIAHFSSFHGNFLETPRKRILFAGYSDSRASRKARRSKIKEVNPALASLLVAEGAVGDTGYLAKVKANFAQAALGIIILSKSGASTKYKSFLKNVVSQLVQRGELSPASESKILSYRECNYIKAAFLCAIYSPIILFKADNLSGRASSIASFTQLCASINLPHDLNDAGLFDAERGCWKLILTMASEGFNVYPKMMGKILRHWKAKRYILPRSAPDAINPDARRAAFSQEWNEEFSENIKHDENFKSYLDALKSLKLGFEDELRRDMEESSESEEGIRREEETTSSIVNDGSRAEDIYVDVLGETDELIRMEDGGSESDLGDGQVKAEEISDSGDLRLVDDDDIIIDIKEEDSMDESGYNFTGDRDKMTCTDDRETSLYTGLGKRTNPCEPGASGGSETNRLRIGSKQTFASYGEVVDAFRQELDHIMANEDASTLQNLRSLARGLTSALDELEERGPEL